MPFFTVSSTAARLLPLRCRCHAESMLTEYAMPRHVPLRDAATSWSLPSTPALSPVIDGLFPAGGSSLFTDYLSARFHHFIGHFLFIIAAIYFIIDITRRHHFISQYFIIFDVISFFRRFDYAVRLFWLRRFMLFLFHCFFVAFWCLRCSELSWIFSHWYH